MPSNGRPLIKDGEKVQLLYRVFPLKCSQIDEALESPFLRFTPVMSVQKSFQFSSDSRPI